jgi:integrase/recombinase XerD
MDYLDHFLDVLKLENKHSASTLQAYAADLRRFRGFLEVSERAKESVTDIFSSDFTAFLESENQSGFSSNTLQRRKMVLAQFAQYLVTTGVFTADQIEDLITWRPNLWQEIYKQEVYLLTDSQIERLLTPHDQGGVVKTFRDLAMISLLLETGLSISELISLRLNDFNYDNKTVKIKRQYGGMFKFMVPSTVDFLDMYIRIERPEVVQSPYEEVLFISQMGGPITRQGVWQMLKAAGDRAKLDLRLSPRVLRHTAVKEMITSGLKTKEIQSRLGHRNIYSTRALVRKVKRAANLG